MRATITKIPFTRLHSTLINAASYFLSHNRLIPPHSSFTTYHSACTLSDTGGGTRSERSQKVCVCWCCRYVECFWTFNMHICWITHKVGLILGIIWFLTWSLDQVCKIAFENVNKHGFEVSQVRTQHFQQIEVPGLLWCKGCPFCRGFT